MDFKEYLIKREKTVKEKFLTVLLYFAATVLAYVCLIIPYIAGIGALLAAGCYYAAFKLSSKFKREYEYITTGDGMDIDVIYNASTRKRLISFSIKDVEILASVEDSNHNARLRSEYKKIIDATTNRADANVYFAVLEQEGRTLVKFEPPYDMLEILKKYAPSKVIISK